ncbi:GuaB1 family IMP dehydrogenase-related protein [Pseudoclavibacter terrae]|uniref:GMP reductase n=1 Tax=Pseudoclavibacter terrae TaxID=1530195 RepID=UPI002330546D|nr:GuaB1 family IMP dehydrogenase-related protein [Pseudoclavibacter terrae]
MHFSGPAPHHELTYSDVFLIPSRSDVGSRLNVSLAPDDGTGMTIPLVASNMNAVTGPRMAAAIARRGGLGVLPQDMSLEALQTAIAWVKSQDPVLDTPFTASGDATVGSVLELVPPVAGFGVSVLAPDGEVLGVLQASTLARVPSDAVLADLSHHFVDEVPLALARDSRAVFNSFAEAGESFAPVRTERGEIATVTASGALRSTIYQPALDARGRLRVAVAVGVSRNALERARALVEAGADVLVLDTAHGHQGSMLRAIEAVRGAELGVPIVAGNVVSGSGVHDLVSAGASIIKVGVGPGAMCTTRMMTAVGRPQFSAVLETSETAHALGARVWADGGVRYPRDVALALAAGGSAVMIGSWFAGTVEAPGTVRTDDAGNWFKESFGMASTKAVEARFGDLEPYERARKLLFAEGISSSKIMLDPKRPGLDDLIDMITTGVRSSFTYAGADSLPEFRQRAKVGIQSAAGYEEGKALPVSW